MVIDPNKAVKEGWIMLSPYSKVQQSGIDIALHMLRMVSGPRELEARDEFLLAAGASYEFQCHEYVKVPQDCIALIIVRSTWNRQGAFITTGLYDNGFSNFVGGVIHNMMKPLIIKANERIAQVVFMRTEHKAQYDGTYQDRSPL